MKPAWTLLLAVSLLGLAAVRANDTDRFSQSLAAEDRTASGLTRLSSDDVAVIDALVRRDTAARARATNADKAPAAFSQRLTADERRTAGLTQLTATELTQLDGCVDRHESAKLARTLLAPPTFFPPRTSRMTPTEAKKEREIHGAFSLSYGFGSGGYSEKTGAMILSLEDPARGYSVMFGYSESHIKGGNLYRDPSYDLPHTALPLSPPLVEPLTP